jgi:hypothetical protein
MYSEQMAVADLPVTVFNFGGGKAQPKDLKTYCAPVVPSIAGDFAYATTLARSYWLAVL